MLFIAVIGAALAPILFSACDLDSTKPDTIFVDTPITLDVLEGSGASDTIQANLNVRVSLEPEDDEAPTPLRITVNFVVPGEDCGAPETNLVTSDANDEASVTWRLGTLAQVCTMEVRALAPSGALLGIVAFDVTIESGKPEAGWLWAGEVVRAVDTLAVDGGQYPLADRLSNSVQWRFSVIDGPAVVLSEDVEDPRSRTLVATGDGSGTLSIVTRFGSFLQAGFSVCTAEEQRWIRVYRTEDAGPVLAACP